MRKSNICQAFLREKELIIISKVVYVEDKFYPAKLFEMKIVLIFLAFYALADLKETGGSKRSTAQLKHLKICPDIEKEKKIMNKFIFIEVQAKQIGVFCVTL